VVEVFNNFPFCERHAGEIKWQMQHPENKIYEIGVPKRHKDATFANFYGNDKLIEKMIDLAASPATDLLFTGPCGCGKTHLAAALLRGLIENGRLFLRPTKFLPVIDFMLEVKSSFNSREITEESIIDEYAKPNLLVFDDLGAEKSSEWAVSTIYALIDQRYRNMKPTFITTNLSLEQIELQLGSRIASRLSEYTIINISMPDYRKKR
jgi:DNA replication protein DnaC